MDSFLPLGSDPDDTDWLLFFIFSRSGVDICDITEPSIPHLFKKTRLIFSSLFLYSQRECQTLPLLSYVRVQTPVACLVLMVTHIQACLYLPVCKKVWGKQEVCCFFMLLFAHYFWCNMKEKKGNPKTSDSVRYDGVCMWSWINQLQTDQRLCLIIDPPGIWLAPLRALLLY